MTTGFITSVFSLISVIRLRGMWRRRFYSPQSRTLSLQSSRRPLPRHSLRSQMCVRTMTDTTPNPFCTCWLRIKTPISMRTTPNPEKLRRHCPPWPHNRPPRPPARGSTPVWIQSWASRSRRFLSRRVRAASRGTAPCSARTPSNAPTQAAAPCLRILMTLLVPITCRWELRRVRPPGLCPVPTERPSGLPAPPFHLRRRAHPSEALSASLTRCILTSLMWRPEGGAAPAAAPVFPWQPVLLPCNSRAITLPTGSLRCPSLATACWQRPTRVRQSFHYSHVSSFLHHIQPHLLRLQIEFQCHNDGLWVGRWHHIDFCFITKQFCFFVCLL